VRAAPIKKGDGATGRTAETLEPTQVPDIQDDSYHGSRKENLMRTGYRAVLAVPLLREDHLLGALQVFRKTPGAFAPEVVELLNTFATQSAMAIQNARLFREIEVKGSQLEVASRHKSDFLANMSHELRTPLNAIIGFSEVLKERMFGELNEKQADYMNDIHESGRHLLSLINDILDLSKIEAGRMELELSHFDIRAALGNAMTLVRERAERHGIALGLEVEPALGELRADERKFKQILLNLLSNAVKFTPDGGRVDVAARLDGTSVEVSVKDTGVGIAPEDQAAVFEEFRQVGSDYTRKAEGTGLGLALTRRFVELHGGQIRLESQPGAGSTFTFTIPVQP
jgi:signal transduction histidine kinase